MDNTNFTFDVSLSLNGSTHKPTNEEIKGFRYRRTTVTYDEFKNYISEGYTTAHVFTENNYVFGNTTKTKDNFLYTNYISIDCDDEDIPMNEYIGNMPCKPSFCYTTYSNEEKGYRFRLVYVFNEHITKNEYQQLYDSVRQCSGIYTLKDNSMRSLSQCMIGNGKNANIIDFGTIFSKSDFSHDFTKTLDLQKDTTGKHECTNCHVEHNFFVKLNSLKPSDFIEYYRNTYEIIQSSELILSDDESYYKFPSPYYEISRGWKWDSFIRKGEIVYFKRENRIRNGQRRRQRLFKWAVLKCRIKPDITLEELIYNMIWERETFFDNSDRVLTNNCIIDICKRAMESNLVFEESEHPNFIVNKRYAKEHGITPNQLKRTVTKKLNSEAIGSWYDCSKSVKDNLEYAKEYGIKVGKTALYEWCKENGVSTKGE